MSGAVYPVIAYPVDAVYPVIYDNDIGSDVDDALTLAMLLGSPEVDLLGVTTVYGDTLLRARIAHRLIGLAGADVQIPCLAGSSETLTGRDIWWAGHEGSTMDDLESETVDTQDVPAYLARQARTIEGLHIIATAPLTNLARAIDADPSFGEHVAAITVMGGSFGPTDDPRPEHNFASDPEAAAIVAGSGIPLVVTGLEITRQLEVTEADVARIVAAGPLGVALGREIEQWWRFNGQRWNVPHDPVAALTLLCPELFEFEHVEFKISVSDAPGYSRAIPAASSRSRLVTGIQTEAVADQMVERIVRACTG